MASERTLKLRERDGRAGAPLRMLEQGPTFAELQPKQIVSGARHNRLKADATALTRAQRKEFQRMQAYRISKGKEPPHPNWAKPKPPEVATPEQVAVIVEDVRGLFERGLVEDGESFDAWHARHFVRDVPIIRKALDAALGEIMHRIKQDGADLGTPLEQGDTHG